MFKEFIKSKDYYKIRTLFRTLVKEIVYNDKTFEIQYSPELFAVEGSQGRVTGLEPATWGSTVPRSTS